MALSGSLSADTCQEIKNLVKPLPSARRTAEGQVIAASLSVCPLSILLLYALDKRKPMGYNRY